MAGLRLDQALARLLPGESRSRLARLIEEGHVPRRRRGGRGAAQGEERRGGRRDARRRARTSRAFRARGDRARRWCTRTTTSLVIDKPAGLVVHPGSGNWARHDAQCPAAPRARRSSTLPRAGIVHRLDKDTSGLLVVAKNEAAQLDLVRQLQARTVKRTYLALVRGRSRAAARVDAPIGRHPVHRTRMAVVAGGKPAVTHYRVRERLPAHTLLECDLETGRTHQIRVHLASIGHPLEGDPRLRRAAATRLLGAPGAARLEARLRAIRAAARSCASSRRCRADFARCSRAARPMTMPADWLVPDWPAPARVRAFVTTRAGGVSEGAYASHEPRACAAATIPAAWRATAPIVRAHLPAEPRWLAQVHGTDVARPRRLGEGRVPRADAAVTARPARVCVVLTADCMPLLLCDAPGHARGRGPRGLARHGRRA